MPFLSQKQRYAFYFTRKCNKETAVDFLEQYTASFSYTEPAVVRVVVVIPLYTRGIINHFMNNMNPTADHYNRQLPAVVNTNNKLVTEQLLYFHNSLYSKITG